MFVHGMRLHAFPTEVVYYRAPRQNQHQTCTSSICVQCTQLSLQCVFLVLYVCATRFFVCFMHVIHNVLLYYIHKK